MTPFLHGLLWFVIGALAGATIGLLVAGLCVAAGRNAPDNGKETFQVWCPKCGKAQHSPHCGNSDCRPCNESIPPDGELYQIWTEDGEGLSCPYCGFTGDGSTWEDLAIKAVCMENGVRTLSELAEKSRKKSAGGRRC